MEKFRPLTNRNLSFHLKKSSSLLKSALNSEALASLSPWKNFQHYIEKVSGDFDFSSIGTMVKKGSRYELTDLVYSTWPQEAVADFLEFDLFNDPLMMALHNKSNQNSSRCYSISEILSIKDYKKTTFFNDFAYPHKVDGMAEMHFPVSPNEFGGFGVYRPSGKYEIRPIVKKFLSALTEDIGMALNQRRLLKQLQGTQASLNRLNFGMILLNEKGFVEMINEVAEKILAKRDPLLIHHNRLQTTDPGSTERLKDLIFRMLKGETRQREHQIILKSSKGNSSLQIMVLSLENQLSETIAGGYVPTAIFINSSNLQEKFPVNLIEIFRKFYGCGERQAEVGSLFSQGLNETEIAEQMKISKETVRSHLNQVYEKIKKIEAKSIKRKQLFWELAQRHKWLLRGKPIK